MARIAGVDLPKEKRVEIGLTYIYGIGKVKSNEILKNVGINPDTRVKDLSEQEVAKIRERISEIESELDRIVEEVGTLQTEIDESNKEIEQKSQESKSIIEYYQIANGENAYLEYAFGATDITDMIYRMAVVEQLTEYNDQIMDELDALITKNKQQLR